ncbi:SDR family NAD(P)-dependent oxidoreductase [Streptococcus sobrinus]|uniref:SDR family NAD(P)-dependent oxidoreductase n=1 Tax=Streptococcus sobrinus TaxID=1310 RepID=UPI0002FCEE21|nr:SDR family NAD(P)-dependent oxidoreductase [Streptococcus sobrinus]
MRKYDRQPKTIIVTGGSSGIGLELAKLLAGEAAEIVLLARNQVKLSQAKTALEALNPSLEVFTISADLSTVEGIFQAIKQVEALHLNIDSLVNNVGYGVSGLADSLDLDTVEKATVANALAPTLLTQAFLPAIVRNQGNILFMGAGAATHPMPSLVHYSASKNLIHGLVRGLRIDLKGTGVHVTEIQPGPVATNFGTSSGGSGSSQDFADNNPLKKVEITPQQCAKESLAALRANKLLHYPGRGYRFLIRLTKLVPSPLMEKLLQRFIQR